MRARIRELNDSFRRSFVGGRVVLTAGVAALPPGVITAITDQVQTFDRFDEGNDPHGEHDFGSLEVGGMTIFWKIDYFDKSLRCHSPNAEDPAVTTRLLTIMLAAEY